MQTNRNIESLSVKASGDSCHLPVVIPTPERSDLVIEFSTGQARDLLIEINSAA
jgi:hypothetical protein